MSELGKRRRESVFARLNANSEHQRQSIYSLNKMLHTKRRTYPSALEFRLRQQIEREFTEYEYEYETEAGWFDVRVVYNGRAIFFDFVDKENRAAKERNRRKAEWCKKTGHELVALSRWIVPSEIKVSIALVKIRNREASKANVYP